MKRALLILPVMLTAGCGGGGAPMRAEPTDAASVPSSALVSSASIVGWTASQQASETRDPLKLEGVTLPASDTDEPLAVR